MGDMTVLCVCGHNDTAHKEVAELPSWPSRIRPLECDALIVSDPPYGRAKLWRSCPCKNFMPKRGCHPVGPSTDHLVCNQCDFSPMNDGSWQTFTSWDDHWDTHD